MEVGEKIRIRREELGLSQEELAFKVGYKSRSSINKIELDGRGLTQSKIKAFADALNTTPSYLMGWEDEEPKQEESELVYLARKGDIVFTDEEKQEIIDFIEFKFNKKNKE